MTAQYKLLKAEREKKRSGFGKHSSYWAYWAEHNRALCQPRIINDGDRYKSQRNAYAYWLAVRDGHIKPGENAWVEIEDHGYHVRKPDRDDGQGWDWHKFPSWVSDYAYGMYGSRDPSKVAVRYNGNTAHFGTVAALRIDNGRIKAADIIVGSGKHGAITQTVPVNAMLPETQAEFEMVFAT